MDLFPIQGLQRSPDQNWHKQNTSCASSVHLHERRGEVYLFYFSFHFCRIFLFAFLKGVCVCGRGVVTADILTKASITMTMRFGCPKVVSWLWHTSLYVTPVYRTDCWWFSLDNLISSTLCVCMHSLVCGEERESCNLHDGD